MSRERLRSDLLSDRHASEPGKAKIEHYEIGRCLFQEPQSVDAVSRFDNLKRVEPQRSAPQAPHSDVVLHNHNEGPFIHYEAMSCAIADIARVRANRSPEWAGREKERVPPFRARAAVPSDRRIASEEPSRRELPRRCINFPHGEGVYRWEFDKGNGLRTTLYEERGSGAAGLGCS